jgi:hypothetical protein
VALWSIIARTSQHGRVLAEKGLREEFVRPTCLICAQAGVPLVLGEPDHYNSFRIGLFGLDKLMHVDKTIRNFEVGLDAVMAAKGM